jgi:hypothetical protein
MYVEVAETAHSTGKRCSVRRMRNSVRVKCRFRMLFRM